MRKNPSVIVATEDHAIAMAPRVRLIDCLEIRAVVDPADFIRSSLADSSHAWVWILDGEPVCMFGLTPRSILGGIGVPWLVATDAIARDRRTFLLGSRIIVRHMLSIYPRLEGIVDDRFAPSVRWIRKLGFTFGPKRDFGGVPLQHFWMER